MSPQAGFILTDKIVPRLKTAIQQVKPVGAEDTEELFQDAIAVAAKMLHDLEQRGKDVTPGNVVYYTILHMKSGRRSYSAGRTDVMNSGTQLDSKSCVLSFETEVGFDEEINEPVRLEEFLACAQDDPSMTASRRMDWEEFIDTHDNRYRPILRDIGEGRTVKDTAQSCGEGYSRIYQLKQKLADDLREFMGEEAIADSLHAPQWKGDIRAEFEKAACRADRRNR